MFTHSRSLLPVRSSALMEGDRFASMSERTGASSVVCSLLLI